MKSLLTPITSRAARAVRSSWLRPVNDGVAWDRLLGRANPLWSLREVRARVVGRSEEGADTFSLWLQPNRRWRGHLPGQHVALGVEINGVLRHRVFSISNAVQGRGPIRLTIRRQPGQGMTDWLFANARPGLVVSLSKPAGTFVLPAPRPERLLMIAAGSGITPMLSMLHALAAERADCDILLLQLSRSAEDCLFAQELADLQASLPGLRVHRHHSAVHGRLQTTDLDALVPDLAQRHTLMCGPQPLMDAIAVHMAARGLSDKLQREIFGRPRQAITDATSDSALSVHCEKTEQTFTQFSGTSLLEAAEAAGLQPRHGCRVGLCRTCLCRKQSGTVRNLLTGHVSAEPNEWVQLCISTAESDVELAL